MKNIERMMRGIQYLGDIFENQAAPLNWAVMFLTVGTAGDGGTTTKELTEIVGVSQGIVSRTVRVMSRSYNPQADCIEGMDLIRTEQDMFNRHRQRVFLSEKGKVVFKKLTEILG